MELHFCEAYTSIVILVSWKRAPSYRADGRPQIATQRFGQRVEPSFPSVKLLNLMPHSVALMLQLTDSAQHPVHVAFEHLIFMSHIPPSICTSTDSCLSCCSAFTKSYA
jgi:hypothetical protein